jgi:uncharacterized protein YeaO (DUF488 family)
MIQIKRVYSEPDKHDGLRILVDRVWPRGFSKERVLRPTISLDTPLGHTAPH